MAGIDNVGRRTDAAGLPLHFSSKVLDCSGHSQVGEKIVFVCFIGVFACSDRVQGVCVCFMTGVNDRE